MIWAWKVMLRGIIENIQQRIYNMEGDVKRGIIDNITAWVMIRGIIESIQQRTYGV